jgi:hypothetical protein
MLKVTQNLAKILYEIHIISITLFLNLLYTKIQNIKKKRYEIGDPYK